MHCDTRGGECDPKNCPVEFCPEREKNGVQKLAELLGKGFSQLWAERRRLKAEKAKKK